MGQVCGIVCLGVLTYVCVYFVTDEVIEKIMAWYREIFIVALFPIFLGWIKDNNFRRKSFWNICPSIMAVVFSIIAYIINDESKEMITCYRKELNVLITIVATVFFMALYKILKDHKKYRSKKLSKKGIRRDLLYRTSGLAINVSNIKLSKHCEKYFDEYIHCYKKIKRICRIEYVNLAGIHRKHC